MPIEKFGYGKRKFEKGVQKGCKRCGKLQIVERGRKTCPRCKE
jgi:hypothetical protein